MSTNGVVAFQIDNKLKTIYNHYDSYPDNLGNNVLDFIRRYDIEELKVHTKQMINKRNTLTTFYDFDVFISHSDEDIFYYEDATSFMERSLFCEWAYIINLDTYELEIYKGYNKEKPVGRFRDVESVDDYYPVSLIRIYNLLELPSKMPTKNLDVGYEDMKLELENKMLESLQEAAEKRKMSVDSLIVEIIQDEITDCL